MRVAYIKDGKASFKSLPKTFKNMPCFDKRAESVWNENGFYLIEHPELIEGQKHAPTGELVGNKYVIDVVDKSAAELEQETAAQREIARAEIKERYVEKVVKREIALNPEDAAIYFDEWTPGTYQIDDIMNYKGKTYENTVADNTNAPDKGGWTELK